MAPFLEDGGVKDVDAVVAAVCALVLQGGRVSDGLVEKSRVPAAEQERQHAQPVVSDTPLAMATTEAVAHEEKEGTKDKEKGTEKEKKQRKETRKEKKAREMTEARDKAERERQQRLVDRDYIVGYLARDLRCPQCAFYCCQLSDLQRHIVEAHPGT